MADTTINFAITGPEEVVDSFVKQGGWSDSSEQTKAEKARDLIWAYMKQMVMAYDINSAQQTARAVAETQTTTKLDLTTVTAG